MPDARYKTCEALLNVFDLSAARREIGKLTEEQPDDARARGLWARLLAAEGQTQMALAEFQRAIDLDPDDMTLWQGFCACLYDADFINAPDGLVERIEQAIKIETIDYKAAELAAQRVLEGWLQARGAEAAWPALAAEQRDAKYGLLLTFLVYGRTTRWDLESSLTRLRRGLLAKAADATVSEEESSLAVALAIHCFNNEYVFMETDEEAGAVGQLERRVAANIASGAPLDRFQTAVLGTYRALIATLPEDLVRALLPAAREGPFGQFLIVQVVEPLEERALRKGIPRVTEIADDHVSQQVKAQYEANPYPRWQRLDRWRVASSARGGYGGDTPGRMLIAGCGTGFQPLWAAMVWPAFDIWAMDLSASSLSYGIRKAAEYGIENVTFVQGDILALDTLPMTFDRIACSGVLHHLKDPARGLALLHAKLADRGQLLLEVYTESGRTSIVAGIALRQEHDLPATPGGIRRFRDIVRSLPADHPAAGLASLSDFYALSECRDLVFHVQEHRFTIGSLESLFKTAGFRLLNLEPEGDLASVRFASMFPGSNPGTDLAAWAQVERRFPGTFGSMYTLRLAKA